VPYAKLEVRRDYQRIYQTEYKLFWRTAALMLLGGKCEKCGWNDMRALQIDHVNGCGAADVKGSRKGSGYFYRRVVREWNSGKYQVLCANHNWIKRFERGEHNNFDYMRQVEEARKSLVYKRLPSTTL